MTYILVIVYKHTNVSPLVVNLSTANVPKTLQNLEIHGLDGNNWTWFVKHSSEWI